MTEESVWKAYKLDIPTEAEKFELIKTHLISYVDSRNLRFWVTWYYSDGDPNPHLWFRVYLTSDEQEELEEYLDSLVQNQTLLNRADPEPWNPENDARDRLTRLWEQWEQRRGENVQLYGNLIIPLDQVLDFPAPREERIEELGALFGAVGEATKAFYNALPRLPKDPLVMSIAIHILLNSLTYTGPNSPSHEAIIRLTPPWGPQPDL